MPNIEEIMRRALEEGKFNDLPGKGKPLRLDAYNPHADPEWELAYKILRDSGYSLPWIETIREIEADIGTARGDLRRAWEWQQSAREKLQPIAFIDAEWQRALKAFESKLVQLNKRIRAYNLEVPNARFQRPVLDYEREVGKITARTERT